MGATITSIVQLLSKEFIRLVVVAGVIAWPIAYFARDSWLEGFQNKIDLVTHSWMFILSTFVAAAFAIATTGAQALKAAVRHPTEALRSE